MTISPMLSRREAASLLTVHIRTIDKLIRTGELQAHRVSTRILIPEDGIKEYLKQRTFTPATRTAVVENLAEPPRRRRPPPFARTA